MAYIWTTTNRVNHLVKQMGVSFSNLFILLPELLSSLADTPM